MSALRVVWPDEDLAQLSLLTDEPSILPFERQSRDHESGAFHVVHRARTLYENRCCKACRYPVVEPIELADGVRNRKGMVIPGTATLVGFRCRGCKSEWTP